MVKSFSCLFFLVFIIPSCEAQKMKVTEPGLKKIYGQWKYLSSSGGFTGRGADWPADQNVIITFKTNGIFQRSGKKMTAVKDTFKLLRSSTIFSDEQAQVIDYKNNIDQSFRISGDTLFLSDEVHDGFSFVFLRKKK